MAAPFIFGFSSVGAQSSLMIHFFLCRSPIFFGILFGGVFLSFLLGSFLLLLFLFVMVFKSKGPKGLSTMKSCGRDLVSLSFGDVTSTSKRNNHNNNHLWLVACHYSPTGKN